jgi:uncharacterized RDD family membrane protein YckC
MMPKEKDLHDDLHLADFAERTIAFGIDYTLFALGWLLSIKLAFPQYGVGWNPFSTQWTLLWTALFILYHAYFASEGRVSLGKRLLGLKVVDVDNEPLSLIQALIRAICYVPGSLLSLGFLWSLVSANRQAWHDLAAGSYVVAPRRRSLVAVRAGAFGVLALFGAAWMWQNVWSQRYNRTMTVAYAHVGFQELAQLQKLHKQKKGKYAEDLISLANVSPAPGLFLADMAGLYDLNAVRIKARKDGYTINAVARDHLATPISFSGS